MSTDSKGRTRDALTTGVQDQIVLLIQRWKPEWGDFSASALERKVTCCLGIKCTRQGLLKKEAIRSAFDTRMGLRTKKAPKEHSADVAVLQQRIATKDKIIAERDAEIAALLEVVTRFRQNAKLLGISAESLEAPIPPLVGKNIEAG